MNFRRFMCGVVLSLLAMSLYAESLESTASKTLLPKSVPVYTSGSVVINHPAPGLQQKALPTNNDFDGNPGCYIACYSHDLINGIYEVGSDIFVNGQVRVPGNYEGRICKPTGYEKGDISKENHFKYL
jgi:hypothetical protein